KRTMLVIAAVSSAVTLGLIACTSGSTAETAVQEVTMDSLVKRGSYLVNAMGCDDCHSPKSFGPQGPEVIEELRFSGYPSGRDRKSTRLNSSHVKISYAVFCLQKQKKRNEER